MPAPASISRPCSDPAWALHHDHLHMDLARHGRRGDRSVCRPYPQPVTPPNQGFPIDPAKNMPMADAGQKLQQSREVYAFAGPRPAQVRPLPPAALGEDRGSLPGYRPAELPAAPRNRSPSASWKPCAPRRRARPSSRRSPRASLSCSTARGGPFLPLQEHEIDPADLDETTGSVGE